MAAIDASQGDKVGATAPKVAAAMGRGVGQAVASKCIISGDGIVQAMVRQTSSFVIEARDAEGQAQESGGDIFTVSVRGASHVRARFGQYPARPCHSVR